MGGRADTRGVSEVLGAILVFSILIALLALFQVTIVPDQNKEIEFNHNERVQQDMGELQGAISSVAATGASGSVSVETGLRYPTRLLLLNPGPVSGTLRTEEVGSPNDIVLSNMQATDTETRDFLDFGSSGEQFATRNIVYDPSYNLYANPPETTYESTVVYNDFDDGVTIKDKGNIISGNRISLVVIDGELSQSSVSSVSVTPDALSAPTRTVTVTGGGAGQNINITVPTKLNASTWENEILDDEMQPTGNVVSVTNHATTDAVFIELNGSVTYELRMAKIGIGSGATDPNAHYVTKVEGDDSAITNSQRVRLTLEVRDRFNNPVSGEEVTFNTTAGSIDGSSPPVTVVTNENGRASVKFDPSINAGTAAIHAGRDTDGDDSVADETAKNKSTFTVAVGQQFTGSSGFGSNLNPSGPVVLESAELTGGGSCGQRTHDCDATITLRNDGANETTIGEARLTYYLAQSPGASSFGAFPDYAIVTDDDGNSERLETQGDLVDTNFNIIEPSGNTSEYTFAFCEEGGGGGPSGPCDPGDSHIGAVEGDLFIVSVVYEDPVTGDVQGAFTYFVAPIGP